MRLVILESPYAGNVEKNILYARAAMLDCLHRGEAPMVSHLLYTQVLDDNRQEQRELGIAAGHAWMTYADAVVVYADEGISLGMLEGIERATFLQLPIEYRYLRGDQK